jgi:hypothetical protein
LRKERTDSDQGLTTSSLNLGGIIPQFLATPEGL